MLTTVASNPSKPTTLSQNGARAAIHRVQRHTMYSAHTQHAYWETGGQPGHPALLGGAPQSTPTSTAVYQGNRGPARELPHASMSRVLGLRRADLARPPYIQTYPRQTPGLSY